MSVVAPRLRTLERYRQPVEGPLAFIRDQIVLPTGDRVGDVVNDDPWIERDVLRPQFERDGDGLPRFPLVYIEVARGHWKTGGAAAVAIAEAVLHDSTDVVVCAGDRDQAAIALEAIDGYLRRNPELARSFRRHGDVAEVPSRGSRIRVISSDAPTAWGLGGTHARFRVICDELTMWGADALWSAVASATGKVSDTQTIVLSNAGFDPEHAWQWKVRQTAEREPWGYLFSPTGVIASWIRPAWVEQQRQLLPPAAFERVIENRWTSTAGDFVTAEQWARCVDAAWSPQTMGTPGVRYVAGLDLGLTKDRTALAVCHRDAKGLVRLDDLLVWEGSRADPVSVENIERAVADVARRFAGVRVYADPWQLKGSIERLGRAGVQIKEFGFSASSVQRLSTALYSHVTAATLRVFPDAELEREVLGLRVVHRAGGWRVDHAGNGYSDRAMAIGLAALNLPPQLVVEPSTQDDGRLGPLDADFDDEEPLPDPFWLADEMDGPFD